MTYLIKFQWLFDTFKGLGGGIQYISHNSKIFGYVIYFYKISVIVSLIALIFLKIWKMNKMNKLDREDNQYENDLDNKNDSSNKNLNPIGKIDVNNNNHINADSNKSKQELVSSEEIWKNF